MKNWYTITAKANAPAVVDIIGPIGNTWDGEGVTASKFIADFRAIDSTEVTLQINSPGGIAFDGVAIYTAIASSGKKVTGKVMGIAASAASLILMACSKIEMPANARLMLHKAGSYAFGNADELREQADVLDGIDKAMVATYAARSGKTDEDIRNLLAEGDVWLSADEAKEAGFCDEVLPLVTATALFDVEQLPEQARAVFAKAPEPKTPTAAALLPEQIEAMCTEAGLQEHIAVFALDEALTTPEQVKAALDQARLVQVLCRVAGASDKAGAFITAKRSVAEVRTALLALRAAEDEKAIVDTTPPADPLPIKPAPAAQAQGPLALWSSRKGTAV